MKETLPRALWVRRLAWPCVALALCVVGLSAYLRLHKTGLDCVPWPACREAALAALGAEAGLVTAARLAHRVVASVVLVLAVMAALTCLDRDAGLRRERRLAFGLLGLGLGLAVLGVFTTGSRSPWIAAGNVLGGFGMVALGSALAAPARTPQPASSRLAWLVTALLWLQALSGVWLSVGKAVLPAGSSLPWVHAAATALVATGLLAFGVVARGQHSRGVLALASLLLLLQVALGFAMLRWGALPWFAWLHNLATAALVGSAPWLLKGAEQPGGATRRGAAGPLQALPDRAGAS